MSAETEALRANRAALNREDERCLVHHAKALARSAMLFPSLVDYTALRTAKTLVDEALSHERTAAPKQSAA